MFELMMYGTAAIMILFIATITAGILLGTAIALMHLFQHVRSLRTAASASNRAEGTVAESSI